MMATYQQTASQVEAAKKAAAQAAKAADFFASLVHSTKPVVEKKSA